VAALAGALENKSVAGFLVEPIQGEAGVAKLGKRVMKDLFHLRWILRGREWSWQHNLGRYRRFSVRNLTGNGQLSFVQTNGNLYGKTATMQSRLRMLELIPLLDLLRRGAIDRGIHRQFGMLARQGLYSIVGFGGTVSHPSVAFVAGETAVTGNLVGNWIDLWEVLQLHGRGDVTLRSKTYPLEEVNDVLDRLREGEVTGRAVLVP
jgi:hypothetical protein